MARFVFPDAGSVSRVWRFATLADRTGQATALVATGAVDPEAADGNRRHKDVWPRPAIANVRDGIIAMDAAGRIESFSQSAEAIFGTSATEIVGEPIDRILTSGPAADLNVIALLGERMAVDGLPRELFARRPTGGVTPLEVAVTPLEYELRRIFLLTVRDLTMQRQTEETVRSLAYLDSVTGLANRLLFQDRLLQAIERGRRGRQMLSVMIVDIDRFKLVNDSFGLEKGDLMLRLVAERLSSVLRRSDTVARLGGDEFLVLLSTTSGPDGTARAAHKVLDALRPPFSLNGHELAIGASIGIAMFPNDGDDPATLIKNADAALSLAKEQSRNHFRFYENTMNARAFEQLILEGQLRKAIEHGQLIVHYQPQINLATGSVVGVEALVRWVHPDHGIVSPSEFIPLAEDTGLIVPIGYWVLRTACGDVRRWQEQGFAGLRLAVNLSARQFQERDLVVVISRVLSDTDFKPTDLELELTESVIMRDATESSKRLQELTALGIQLAVDDFGTGYSSLSYLRRFPIRSLKIDRTFVRDVDRDPNGAAIAQAIVALGSTLGLKVVAEGVETREQMEALRRYGCDEMQGYLFSRPVPKDDLLPLLKVGVPLTG
ncbi:MAG: EAL domain-containing protein [Rhodospirillales bacterium]|nr:EAL domain-containing protein [Rhodospirillales bacterium]